MKSIAEIKQLPDNELKDIVEKIDSLPLEERDRLRRLALDDCYDESWCKENGIDYYSIKNRDFIYMMIYEYFMMLTENYKE
jgi:hypothetical protein